MLDELLRIVEVDEVLSNRQMSRLRKRLRLGSRNLRGLMIDADP